MFPESEDNYGSESCSILCLHPLISSPPILVIATNGGNLNHCVVLAREGGGGDDADEIRSQISEWSSSTTFAQDTSNLSLFVYETVELELGMRSTSSTLDKTKPFEYPILLHPDPTSPARYFCSHKAGVHCIGLPMVTALAKVAQLPAEQRTTTLPSSSMDEESVVEHLICTQMSRVADPAPILGLSVHYPPTSLLVLLSDFSVQSLALSPPYFGTPPPLLSKGEAPLTKHGSGVAQHHSREPFEMRIKQILQKSSKHPLMKGGANVDMSKQECLDLLTMSTQV